MGIYSFKFALLRKNSQKYLKIAGLTVLETSLQLNQMNLQAQT